MAVREVGALLGLSALGGLWAVAWGIRRAEQPARIAMLDARTQLQVRLDAVRARTAILARQVLPDAARQLVDDVVERQVLIDAVLSRASSVAELRALEPDVAAANLALEQAAELVDLDMPADAPFAGLCGVDPGHGPAESTVDVDGGIQVCERCAEAAARGEAIGRRMVCIDGRPAPFTTALG
jgi:hypothetical protein